MMDKERDAIESGTYDELLRSQVEKLRTALYEIIGLDHHNHGPESRATKIARNALNQPVNG